jgi:hypothetical protein
MGVQGVVRLMLVRPAWFTHPGELIICNVDAVQAWRTRATVTIDSVPCWPCNDRAEAMARSAAALLCDSPALAQARPRLHLRHRPVTLTCDQKTNSGLQRWLLKAC